MIIYGCPTSGKTTAFETLQSKGYMVIDTDVPYSLWTITGDPVPEVIRPYRKLKASAPSSIKQLVKDRIQLLYNQKASIIILTNFNIEKNLFAIGFGRDEEALKQEWDKRGDNQAHTDLTAKISDWSRQALSMRRFCERFIILEESEYISDYLDDIFSTYKRMYK